MTQTLRAWLSSEERRVMLMSHAYYNGIQAINTKIRTVFDDMGKQETLLGVHNERVTYNLFRKIVNQKVRGIVDLTLTFPTQGEDNVDWDDPKGFEESVKKSKEEKDKEKPEKKDKKKEDTDDTDDDDSDSSDDSKKKVDGETEKDGVLKLTEKEERERSFVMLLNRLFDDEWKSTFSDGMTDCFIDGEVWLYPYIVPEGEPNAGDFKLKFMRACDIYPEYTDINFDEPARIFHLLSLRNPGEMNDKYIVEMYTKDGRTTFKQAVGDPNMRTLNLEQVGNQPYFKFTPVTVEGGEEDSEPEYGNWDHLPFIRIKTSRYPEPFINRVKSLCDLLNSLYSNWADVVLDSPDGKILVTVNTSGDPDSRLRSRMLRNRHIKLMSSKEEPNVDAKFLTDQPPSSDYEAIIKSVRMALFESGGAFDDQNPNLLGANIHEVVMSAAMLTMIQDRDLLVMQVERAISKLIWWFYVPYLEAKGFGDYSDISVGVVLGSGGTGSITELTQVLVSLGMKMSNKTILEHHPWIEDVNEELERINAEQEMVAQQELDMEESKLKLKEKYTPEPPKPAFGGASGNTPNQPSSSGAQGAQKAATSGTQTTNTGSPNGGGKPQDAIKFDKNTNSRTEEKEKEKTNTPSVAKPKPDR
jgi:hypothetical protein